MSDSQPIRNVSDTAIWAAIYRARENERANAIFRDPYAHRLAGERGDAIAKTMKHHDRNEWAWLIRTWNFDHFINREIAAGADMVINLAAGLDARPYRLALPPSLKWIEVDLPDLIAYKSEILRDERPNCDFERISLDLADVDARRALFVRLGAIAKRAVIITEGLLIYLTPEENLAFARDLAAQPSFQRWIFDIASPGLLKMLRKQVGKQLEEANAPLKFGPDEGIKFFEPAGWRELDHLSSLQSAGNVLGKRLSWLLRFFSRFPEPAHPGNRPWAATVLMGQAR